MRYPRISLKRSALMFAALAVFSCPVHASLPELPSSAIVSDSFLVVHVDGAKVDPASIDQSVQALLGPAASFIAPKVQMLKDDLKNMVDAGAESLTVVASGDPRNNQPAVIGFVKLKSGTDHAAFQQKVRDEQAKQEQASGGKGPTIDMKDEGDFVILKDKNMPASEGAADSDRAKEFTGGFPADNKALQAVFIPTTKIRQQMKDDISKDQNEPVWAADLGKSVAECKSIAFDLSLGASPVLDLSVQTKDDESGKKLADAVDQGVQQLKAQAAQMKQAGGQFAAMANSMDALADGLKPKQEASKVSVSVEGKVIAPAIANILPMMMMHAPAGPNPGQPPANRPAGNGGL